MTPTTGMDNTYNLLRAHYTKLDLPNLPDRRGGVRKRDRHDGRVRWFLYVHGSRLFVSYSQTIQLIPRPNRWNVCRTSETGGDVFECFPLTIPTGFQTTDSYGLIILNGGPFLVQFEHSMRV